MTKNINPGILLYDEEQLPPFNRLVILVPNNELDEIKLARRIRAMMPADEASLLLLSLVTREEEESLERRRLTNLAFIMGDPVYTIRCKQITGTHWVEAIKTILRPGDLLVCLNGQNAPSRTLKHQPIGQVLASQLTYPVYVLNNIATNEGPSQKLGHRIIGWLAPIAIIIFFLGFDIRIFQDAGGWTTNLLLVTSLFIEAGLIWSWGNLWN